MMFRNHHFGAAVVVVFIILALWEAVWKGIGMWRAGRNDQLGWFVAILILNTVGILPIVYLAFFQPETPAAKRSRR